MTTATKSAKQHARLAAALTAERTRLLESLRGLAEAERVLGESQGDEGGPGSQSADLASDLVEQELDLAIQRSEVEQVREIDAALARLRAGSYGTCERCGTAIAPERLEARPWVRLCVPCAEKAKARATVALSL